MATVVQCLSSCANLNSKFKVLSLKGASSSPTSSFSARRGASATVCSSLSFSQSVSQCVAFSTGNMLVQNRPMRRQMIVCEAAPTKKADSAAKRARQAEKRRVYNKSKKSEARTRMKKVNGQSYYFASLCVSICLGTKCLENVSPWHFL